MAAERIEFVLPSLEVGGMETLVIAMARALTRRGRTVGITCLEREGALADDARAAGARVSLVPTPGVRTLVDAPALRAHFRRVRPDVVHTHNGVWGKGARAARGAGVPRVVHTLHSFIPFDPWFVNHAHRWGARHTDAIVAVSEVVRDALARDVRVPPAKLHRIVNGVDTARFRPHGGRSGFLRGRFGVPDEALLVGIVARLEPVKNHALLLDAFARARAVRPDVHLAVVGDGPLRAELEARAAALGIAGAVHFAGSCVDTPAVFRDLDVAVLSSVSEGTPMSVLEAMAAGLPVVATAVGGIPHLLQDGAGVLVPSGAPDDYAGGLVALLGAPERRAAIGQAGRARVEARFGVDAMLDQYEALYDPASRPASDRLSAAVHAA